jgi:hypothetical protein
MPQSRLNKYFIRNAKSGKPMSQSQRNPTGTQPQNWSKASIFTFEWNFESPRCARLIPRWRVGLADRAKLAG